MIKCSKIIVFKIRKIIFSLLLFISILTNAQEEWLVFKHLGPESGLDPSEINCIVQDKKGFIWIGSPDGLIKFNGYEFIYYRNEPTDSLSLSNNTVNCLFVDSKGTLWVGTESGLDRFNSIKNNFTVYKYNPSNRNSISNDHITCIEEDNNGLIWVGTKGGGLNSLNTKTNVFTNYIHKYNDSKSIADNNVQSITADGSSIWIGTGNGLDLYREEINYFYHFKLTDFNKAYSNYISHVIKINKNNLWIGTDNYGLFSFNIDEKKFENNKIFENPGQNTITSIFKDKENSIWVGTDNGLFKFYDFSFSKFNEYYSDSKRQEYSLSSNGIRCVFKDKDNSLWIGTKLSGINTSYSNTKKFNYYYHKENEVNTLSNNTVTSICEDKDNLLWIGTYMGGLNSLDRKNNQYKQYSTFEGYIIWNIIEDKNGVLWFATHRNGLHYFDKKNNKWGNFQKGEAPLKPNSNNITYLYDDNNLLWIGTVVNGINIYNKQTKKFFYFNKENGLADNTVFSIVKDKKGNAWIGTNGGLTKYNYETNVFNNYFNTPGEDKKIMCIYIDKNNKIWLGTKNGLIEFNPETEKYKIYTNDNGLQSTWINAIGEDENHNLWISTNHGISNLIFGKDSLKIKNYDINDGLQSNEFNQNSFYKSKKGEMFFGGVSGLNTFFPNEIKDNPNIPPVIITSFKLFDKEVKLDTNISEKKYIELSWKENFLEFEFVALNYLYPSKNKYKFRMIGLNDKWSVATNRRYVSFQGLNPGYYTFQVIASNNDGVWNEKGTYINIYIKPPFWQTVWFRISSIILGFIIVFMFFRIRTRRILKEKHVLEEKVAERTEELREKNKHITDSIVYAKRIQNAIFPPKTQIDKILNDYFILFLPKDIVSGDFYWVEEKNNKILVAAVDCTGHGVPGAFMSIVGNNLLSDAINIYNLTKPNDILNKINLELFKTIKQENDQAIRDGMDISLCVIDKETNILQFSAALNPCYIIRNNELIEIKADRFSIGSSFMNQEIKEFQIKEIQLQKNDIIYIFSDGYADQFGGEKGKKMMYKRFKEILLNNSKLEMNDQKNVLEMNLLSWRGEIDQIDDIVIIGIKI